MYTDCTYIYIIYIYIVIGINIRSELFARRSPGKSRNVVRRTDTVVLSSPAGYQVGNLKNHLKPWPIIRKLRVPDLHRDQIK